MMETISSVEEFNKVLKESEAVLAYFSSENCSVCKVLKPKVEEMLAGSFPRIRAVYIHSDQLPELAAQISVFSAPTVVVFFDGRESLRKSRTFGIDQLKGEINRPYDLIFG